MSGDDIPTKDELLGLMRTQKAIFAEMRSASTADILQLVEPGNPTFSKVIDLGLRIERGLRHHELDREDVVLDLEPGD